MTAADFIAKYKADAVAIYEKYGVLPSVTLSAGLLESGNDTSSLATKYNNLFGIKGSGTAGSVSLATHEEVNGISVPTTANFAAYNSTSDSLNAYGALLGTGSRYAGVRSATDYKTALQALQKSGYATSSTYAVKLDKIIEDNKLYNLDASVVDGSYTVPNISLTSAPSSTSNSGTESTGIIGSITDWIKTAGFVIVGAAILIVGAIFLFGGHSAPIVIKEDNKNE